MAEREFTGGWATTLDGQRVPISPEEAEAIWKSCEAADARRREAMPDSLAALSALQDARTRLKDEGWRDGIYCPKDGSGFAVIEYGSTGIFPAFYSGEWPKGYLHIGDCIGSPRGVLWKSLDALTDAERSRFDECVDAERRMVEADARRFAALADESN